MSADRSTPVQVTLSLSDVEAGTDVLNHLAECIGDEGCRIDAVTIDGDESSSIVVDGISPKQTEAVHLAVEWGYYRTPKEATLEDISEELGVSKSAVSQRLRRAERTLIRSFVASRPPKEP